MFMGVWPNAIGICGALLILASVVGIALEEKYLSNNNQIRTGVQVHRNCGTA